MLFGVCGPVFLRGERLRLRACICTVLPSSAVCVCACMLHVCERVHAYMCVLTYERVYVCTCGCMIASVHASVYLRRVRARIFLFPSYLTSVPAIYTLHTHLTEVAPQVNVLALWCGRSKPNMDHVELRVGQVIPQLEGAHGCQAHFSAAERHHGFEVSQSCNQLRFTRTRQP